MARNGPPGKDDDDRGLWAAVTSTVRPLADRPKRAFGLDEPADGRMGEAVPDPAPKRPADPNRAARQKAARERILKAAAEAAAESRARPARRSAPPALEVGSSPGVDRRTADRFKRGKLAIDGRLDLHGMSREAAQTALFGFIATSHATGKRCVVVVTGKGRGILREAVPHWLNLPALRDKILAVDTARPEHGGTGALYVLLKRRRDRGGGA